MAVATPTKSTRTTKKGNGGRSQIDAMQAGKAARNAIARNETPEQKFARLATERTDAALGKLRQVKNTAAYPFSPTAAKKIVNALDIAMSEVRVAFFPPSAVLGKKGGFRLDDNDDSRT